MKKTKILFAGMGGVGGYFGGKLAHFFEKEESVEVGFIARAEHMNKIKTEGLKVVQGVKQLIARPSYCTDTSSEIGIVDFIFFCTKTYDLKNISESLSACIDENTVLISLLNGTNNPQIIQKIYPNNLVLNGCVYIVSRLVSPGIIENTGNIQKLFFGKDMYENERLKQLEALFKKAQIDATYSQTISQIIWEKFIFLSPIATATTSFNKTIGELLQDEHNLATIHELIKEVKGIAEAKGIFLQSDIVEKTMAMLKSLPSAATSSMHTDFRSRKPKNELDALSCFVIEEGKKNGIETPYYDLALAQIKNNFKTN